MLSPASSAAIRLAGGRRRPDHGEPRAAPTAAARTRTSRSTSTSAPTRTAARCRCSTRQAGALLLRRTPNWDSSTYSNQSWSARLSLAGRRLAGRSPGRTPRGRTLAWQDARLAGRSPGRTSPGGRCVAGRRLAGRRLAGRRLAGRVQCGHLAGGRCGERHARTAPRATRQRRHRSLPPLPTRCSPSTTWSAPRQWHDRHWHRHDRLTPARPTVAPTDSGTTTDGGTGN